MTEQQKLYRLLKLIPLLKTGYGRTPESLAGDLDCSERTVRRYLKLLDDTGHRHRDAHEKQATDIFGYSGDEAVEVILKMSLRAYLLLREEYPQSIPYLSRDDDGNYIFHFHRYSIGYKNN